MAILRLLCDLQSFLLQQIVSNCAEDPLEAYFFDTLTLLPGEILPICEGFRPHIFAAFLKVFWDCMWWNPSIHMADFEFAGIYRRFLAIKVAKNWAFLTNQTCLSQKWILPTPWEFINIYIDYENYIPRHHLPIFFGTSIWSQRWIVIQDTFCCFWLWLCSTGMMCFFKSRPRANAKRTTYQFYECPYMIQFLVVADQNSPSLTLQSRKQHQRITVLLPDIVLTASKNSQYAYWSTCETDINSKSFIISRANCQDVLRFSPSWIPKVLPLSSLSGMPSCPIPSGWCWSSVIQSCCLWHWRGMCPWVWATFSVFQSAKNVLYPYVMCNAHLLVVKQNREKLYFYGPHRETRDSFFALLLAAKWRHFLMGAKAYFCFAVFGWAWVSGLWICLSTWRLAPTRQQKMVEGLKRCKGFNERDYMLFNSTLKFDDRCNNFIHTNSDGQDVTVAIPAALKIRMPFWDTDERWLFFDELTWNF